MEALIIIIVITVLIWIGCRYILIGQMSNVHSASGADDYLIRDSVDIIEKTDTYLYTDVSRRPKPKKE